MSFMPTPPTVGPAVTLRSSKVNLPQHWSLRLLSCLPQPPAPKTKWIPRRPTHLYPLARLARLPRQTRRLPKPRHPP